MKTRWLKRTNDEGIDEKFYPITHVDAIVMGENDESIVSHVNDKNNPHGVTAEQAGALPITGGTLSESATIYWGTGAWMTGAKNIIQMQGGDNNNYSRFTINNSLDLSDCISYRKLDLANNFGQNYRIFGEHNKELLASTLESLMANGGMSTLQSAIQITNAPLIGSSGAFTGTGKGKLFLTCNNEGVVAEIVIDGRTLNSPKFSNNNATIEIEFLKSFSVKNTSTGYYIYANAVFY